MNTKLILGVVAPAVMLAVLLGSNHPAPAVPAPAAASVSTADVDLAVCATHPGAHRTVIQADQLDQACVQNLRSYGHP
jgi:hypothetical protein